MVRNTLHYTTLPRMIVMIVLEKYEMNKHTTLHYTPHNNIPRMIKLK